MICSYGIRDDDEGDDLNVGQGQGGSPQSPTNLKLEVRRVEVSSETQMAAMYPSFFQSFLIGNQPCLITSKGQTSQWPATKKWVTKEGQINWDYLNDTYGEVDVRVTTVEEGMTNSYGGMETELMSFSSYLEYWKNYRASGYPPDQRCLYLKDWHILRNFGNAYYASTPPYKVLPFFSSDWLNEACDKARSDDYRFVYMGPKGSWTPFHADVFGSFSWSVNIIGKKKWRLYPPGKPRGKNAKGYEYDPNCPGVRDQDYVEIVQEVGETLFVPSGWHHIVWNEEDSISINHNWFNAANVCYIWHQLERGLDLVKIEMVGIIDDEESDEYWEQCQKILYSNHGFDYGAFIDIILRVWGIRNKQCADSKGTILEGEGFNQTRVDYQVMKHLTEEHLLPNPDITIKYKEALRTYLSQIP